MMKSASAHYFREKPRAPHPWGRDLFRRGIHHHGASHNCRVVAHDLCGIRALFSTGAAVTAGQVWLWPVDFTLYNYQAVLRYKTVWIG